MDRTNRICSLGLFLAGYIFYNSSLLEIHYSTEFHLNPFDLGVAQAAVPFGAMLGAIFAGQFGSARLLRWCFLLLSLCGILSGFSYDFYSFSFLRLCNGFLAGMLYPLSTTYVATEDQLAVRTAKLMFVNCLAFPIACLMSLLLEFHFPGPQLWRMLVLLQSIPALCGFLLVNNGNLIKTQNKSYNVNADYRFLTFCLATTWFLMDIAYYGINFFVPYLLNLFAVNYGVFFIAISFAVSAGLAIIAVKKVDLYKLQTYGFLLAGLSLSSLLFQQDYMIVVLFIIFNIALNIGPDVTTYLFSAISYPEECRTRYHGFNAGIAKSGSVLGILFLPVLQNYFGINFVIIILAILIFLATFLSLVLENLQGTKAIYETN